MRDPFYQFTEVSYSGRRLLEKYKLSDEGVWQIYGEDPNCDMGGHHHQPYITTLSGKLQNVIAVAVTLPQFWQWGAGGEIKKIEIEKVDAQTIKKRVDNRAKIMSLQASIRQLEEEQYS